MSTTIDKHATLGEIAAVIREHHSFVLLSHVRPDGDAIGSQAGLALCLRAMGKEVVTLNEDGCPENMDFLPGAHGCHAPGRQGAR